MALIKTDNQNYTNIANTIRELVGVKTIFDEEINITKYDSISEVYYLINSEYEYIVENYSNRVGEVFEVIHNDITYRCELKEHIVGNGNVLYYLGNLAHAYTGDGYPDTGEPFYVGNSKFNDSVNFYTTYGGTHHFTIKEKYYKPSQMKPALDKYIPDHGISFNSDGTVATTYGSKVVGFTYNTTINTVNLSEQTLEICDRAFEYTNLTSITLPNNVRRIGQWAFFGSSKLENINFPNNLKVIDYCGLYKTNLKVVELPSSIEKIGYGAFNNCSNLESITFNSIPSSFGSDVFGSCSKLTTINVPWSEGEISGAPWGATNATINYNYAKSTEV